MSNEVKDLVEELNDESLENVSGGACGAAAVSESRGVLFDSQTKGALGNSASKGALGNSASKGTAKLNSKKLAKVALNNKAIR